jgi:hypothetical protein
MLYWLFTSWSHVLLAVQKSCARAFIMSRRVGGNDGHTLIDIILCWNILAPRTVHDPWESGKHLCIFPQ